MTLSPFDKTLEEDLNEFGKSFKEDLHLPVGGKYIVERILLGLVRAHPNHPKTERQRVRTAMKALVNAEPEKRPQAQDDSLALSIMAQWYQMDRERGRGKPRSVEKLAKGAEEWAGPGTKKGVSPTDRLVSEFKKNKKALIAELDDRIVEVGVLQDLALIEIEERLRIFGVDFEPY